MTPALILYAPFFISVLFLNHRRVETETTGFIRKSHKVVTHFTAPAFIKLKCEGGGEGRLLGHIQAQMEAKPWARKAEAAGAVAEEKVAVFSTHSAGIGGLIRRQERGQRKTKQLAEQAFSDLGALMSEASKMVSLIERYTEAQKREAKEDGDGKDAEQFDSLLQQIGIANPVTKSTAGNLYREELARELADFLAQPLEAAGGMLALTDIYCMFNRARGTELISPDDLLNACTTLTSLGLPMHLRTFPSGVKVVQSASHSDANVAERVKAVMAEHGGESMTAAEFATTAKVSFSVARQQLVAAEGCGAVCRDESFEGLIFFPNLFAV